MLGFEERQLSVDVEEPELRFPVMPATWDVPAPAEPPRVRWGALPTPAGAAQAAGVTIALGRTEEARRPADLGGAASWRTRVEHRALCQSTAGFRRAEQRLRLALRELLAEASAAQAFAHGLCGQLYRADRERGFPACR